MEIGISVVAADARANRFVVDDVAVGVGAAIARIFAKSIDASFGWFAIVVAGAFELDERFGGFASAAAAADVSAGADTDHGAYRMRW